MPKKESGTRKQDYIIQLVSSLNAAEKRYFKMATAQQKGEKKYNRLFDEIARVGQYDAEALSRKLKVTKKQLADDKNYLQSILLDAVKNFDTGRNSWHHGYLEGLALYDRGLYHYAIDHLNSVIAGAEKEEHWAVVQSALMTRSACLLRIAAPQEELDRLHQHFLQVLDKAKEQEILRHLSYSFSIIANGIDLNKADLSYRQHPLYQADYTSLSSLRAQMCWFTLHLGDAMVVSFDAPEALRLARKQAEHFGSEGRLLDINPGAYYGMMIYWANAEENAGNIDKALSIIKDLLQLLDKPRKSDTQQTVANYSHHARQILAHLHLMAHDYPAAISAFASIYTNLKSYNEPNQVDILHFYALSLLLAGRPAEASDILEELLTMNSKTREDLYVSARLLILLVQYDLDNFDVLLHNIVSTKSYFVRHKIEDKRFAHFLKHFASVVKAADKKTAIRTLMDEMLQQPSSRDVIPFPRREIIYWLEQKLVQKKKPAAHT